jgi:leader peptidase (prepilin peptidase)/N-methyltransferase
MTTTHHMLAVSLWVTVGSCLGSFLNVCVYRIPRRISLVRPRSACPRCGSAILARDNVPVLGWLLLRGRCRDCGGAISPRYPAIELAVGLLYALPYLVAVGCWAGDPWERIGAGPMFAILLACWTVTWLGVLAIVLGLDARSALIPIRATAPHRAGGGCEGPAASVPPSPADPG